MVVRVVSIEGTRVIIETPFTDVFKLGEMEISVGKKKRSLNANAFFHSLVGKMADKLNVPKQEVKNTMLIRYGQYEIQDGEQVIICALSSIDMMSREDIHCSPIAHDTRNGKDVTYYAIMKPSSNMNSYEFAKLLDGTIQEARNMGIDVPSEEEYKRMMKEWSTNQS